MVLPKVTLAPRAALAFAVLATSATVRAEAPCFAAFTDGQRASVAGKLLEARARLSACVSDKTCPAPPLLTDCAKQLEAVNARLGSIVVSLSDGSTRARVSVDGTVVATSIDGKAIELDPGTHHVVAGRDGAPELALDVLVPEGAKLRQVVLQGHDVRRPTPPPPPLEAKPRIAAWAIGGVGIALVGAFGVVAGVGQATYGGCPSKGCSASTLGTLRVERAVAWTALGVGAVALVASTALFTIKF
jgi:hypothetical protein